MKLFKKGVTVKEFIKELEKFPQDKVFYVASDEELNIVFKGIFLQEYNDCVAVAGLTGLELEE